MDCRANLEELFESREERVAIMTVEGMSMDEAQAYCDTKPELYGLRAEFIARGYYEQVEGRSQVLQRQQQSGGNQSQGSTFEDQGSGPRRPEGNQRIERLNYCREHQACGAFS